MKSPAGDEMPRTRREAWAQHVRRVRADIASEPHKAGHLEMMLARQREDCEAGRFPWGQYPLEDRPTDDEITTAMAECIAENGGRHIGRDELWTLVQDKFLSAEIPPKVVEGLMPKRRRGRPPKS